MSEDIWRAADEAVEKQRQLRSQIKGFEQPPPRARTYKGEPLRCYVCGEVGQYGDPGHEHSDERSYRLPPFWWFEERARQELSGRETREDASVPGHPTSPTVAALRQSIGRVLRALRRVRELGSASSAEEREYQGYMRGYRDGQQSERVKQRVMGGESSEGERRAVR